MRGRDREAFDSSRLRLMAAPLRAAVLAALTLCVLAATAASANDIDRWALHVSPATASGSSAQRFTIKVVNDSVPVASPLRSVNLIPPSGFRVLRASLGGKGSAKVVGNRIQLRNLGFGHTLALRVLAIPPPRCAKTSGTWRGLAKEGAGFTGPTLSFEPGRSTAQTQVKQRCTFAAKLTPSAVAGGASQLSMTVTITNTRSNVRLRAANLTAPPGFTVTRVSRPKGKGSASVAGSVVKLRRLSIKPHGGSLRVSLEVSTPGTCAVPYVWKVAASARSNFTGQRFSLSTPASFLTTRVNGACSLRFGTEPHSARLNTAISGADYDPSAGPVTVKVVDSSGNVITSSNAPVTISLASNPGNASLGGTRTVNAKNGIATFRDLSLATAQNGYTLSASTPNLAAATSTAFNENDEGSGCLQRSTTVSETCITSESSPRGNAADVTAGGDPAHPGLTTLAQSLDVGQDTLSCSGLVAPSVDWWEFAVGASFWSKTVTVTVRPTQFLGGTIQAIVRNEQLCYGAPYAFVTNAGVPAARGTLPDGSQGFVGELPDCGSIGATACIKQRGSAVDVLSPIGFDLVLTMFVPAGLAQDPHLRCC